MLGQYSPSTAVRSLAENIHWYFQEPKDHVTPWLTAEIFHAAFLLKLNSVSRDEPWSRSAILQNTEGVDVDCDLLQRASLCLQVTHGLAEPSSSQGPEEAGTPEGSPCKLPSRTFTCEQLWADKRMPYVFKLPKQVRQPAPYACS